MSVTLFSYKITFVRKDPGHIAVFFIEGDGCAAFFRVSYMKTKKELVTALEAYYDREIEYPDNYATSFRLSNMTDLCLYVERKKQWILETVDFKKL